MAFGHPTASYNEGYSSSHIRMWENVQQNSTKEDGPCSMLHSHMHVTFSRGFRQRVCARDEFFVMLPGEQGCALGHWGKS